jgi:CheY-like chemotaxis protein
MSSKRALVVDDSKSARAFLSRILERHEIAVDAAESAEAAIDYLTRNKPDVIFMDHMMPGMDGFQAVQSIKNNPRTAAIPILMYTSQEGDLYLGQARALGAEGVLPKQIKQADVTKLLFQLRLVSDRRGGLEQSAFTRLGPNADLLPANEAAMDMGIVVPRQPADAPAAVESVAAGPAVEPGTDVARLLPQLSLEIRAALDTSLRKELADLRGFLGTALDGHAERLHGDLATLLPPSRGPDVDMPTMISDRRPWAAILGWSLAVLASGCAAVSTWLWWNQGGEIAALRTDLAAAYAEAEVLRARPAVVSVPPPVEASPAVSPTMPPDASLADGALPEGSAASAAPAEADAAAGAAPLATVPATVPTTMTLSSPAASPAASSAMPSAASPARSTAPQSTAPVATPATAEPIQAQ